MRIVAAGLAILVASIFGLIWLDSTRPNSSSGVSIVGDNTARLPEGEVFILTHQVGKTSQTWRITFDGRGSVHLDKDAVLFGWGSDHVTGKLCGLGCTTDVGMGWGDHFYLTLRSDEAVNVKWPWGWDYRAPKN